MAKSKGKEKAAADPSVQPEVEEVNANVSNDQIPAESVDGKATAAQKSDSEISERNQEEGVKNGDVEGTNVNEEGESGKKSASDAENSDEDDDDEDEEDEEEEEVVGEEQQGQKLVATNDKKQVNSVKGGNLSGKKKAPSAAAEAAAKVKNASVDQGSQKKGMGLIFMCNNQTKGDCFKYRVLGLPESKKDTVAKIYKGMRLFLFDTDLKLLYGIYKAVRPGGYNIEKKAFNSAFPSQVRFTTLNDCKPLPEEKFKAAIKSNYYRRNRFNCELSSEQVKNLCKLFQEDNSVDARKRRNSPLRSGGPYKKRATDRGPYRRAGYGRSVALRPPPDVPTYALERVVADYGYNREIPADPYRREAPYAVAREPVAYRDPYLYPPSGPVVYREAPYAVAREPATHLSYAPPSYPASAPAYYAHPGYR